MKKYFKLVNYELKNIMRNSTNRIMLFYPIVVTLITIFLFPMLIEKAKNPTQTKYAVLLLLITVIAISGFMVGALLAFGLIEKKDEKSIYTIAVTPISIKGYISFQVVFCFIMTVISNLLVLICSKLFAGDAYSYTIQGITYNILDNLSYFKIIIFSFVTSFWSVGFGLLIASIANNGVEGFAYLKSIGSIVLLPLLITLKAFNGKLQYLLGIMPNFWTIKGLLSTVMPSNPADLNFYLYQLIGVVYGIILIFAGYKIFTKKSISTI